MQTTQSEIFLPSVAFIIESMETLERVRNIFRLEQYHLSFYSQPSNGIQHLKKTMADVVVIVPLEEIAGYNDFFLYMQRTRPEIRIVLITSQVYEPQGLEAVAKGLVHKLLITPVPDDLLKSVICEMLRLQYQFRFESLQKKLASYKSLPAPSRFQDRLKQLLNKRDRSMKELVAEIEKNPALVAKVLQVANSVHFWTRIPITTVWDSVILIGTQNIASLIAAIEIFDTIGKNASPEVKAYYELLWNRSLTRANIAKQIAEEWEEMKEPQIAYVTALLQDIGLLIRLVNEPIRYREMMHRIHTHHISLAEAELQIFTHSHVDVGAFMLQLWNFPKEIVTAVAHHHGNAYDNPLTQTIQIADILTTSDPTIPHDPSIDPFLDIWTARLGSMLTSQAMAQAMAQTMQNTEIQ